MGPRDRRERERQETRTRILDAARDMLVNEGVEAVTMRAIAKRIEYTPTAIYHHFRDKQALIAELVATDFLALSNTFRRRGHIADPVERLRAIGLAYVEFGISHPSHYRVLFMTPELADTKGEVIQGQRQARPGENAYEFLRTTVAECITTGRFRPELRDPDLVAQMMWAGVHGLVSLHIAFAGSDAIGWCDARKTARALVDNATRGALRERDVK